MTPDFAEAPDPATSSTETTAATSDPVLLPSYMGLEGGAKVNWPMGGGRCSQSVSLVANRVEKKAGRGVEHAYYEAGAALML